MAKIKHQTIHKIDGCDSENPTAAFAGMTYFRRPGYIDRDGTIPSIHAKANAVTISKNCRVQF